MSQVWYGRVVLLLGTRGKKAPLSLPRAHPSSCLPGGLCPRLSGCLLALDCTGLGPLVVRDCSQKGRQCGRVRRRLARRLGPGTRLLVPQDVSLGNQVLLFQTDDEVVPRGRQ